MFKASPPAHSAADHAQRRPPDSLRSRTLELAALELRHQPMLKLRAFGAGLLTGMALVIGAEIGYQLAAHAANASMVEAAADVLQEPRQSPR